MPGDGACAFPCGVDQSPILHPAHWSSEIAPSVVILDTPCIDTNPVIDAILQRSEAILSDNTGSDGRHLVIADRLRRHRLWIRSATSLDAETFETLADQTSCLRLGATLQFSRWLHGSGPQLLRPLLVPTPYQRQRLVQLLRISDAVADGADLRDIAYTLVFRNQTPLAGRSWKDSSDRRSCQRLVAAANRLIAGDYRKLLAA